MDKARRKKLESRGWKQVTVGEFLELTPEQEALIEARLVLADALKKTRQKAKLTQAEVAVRIRSTQPRVAKMEAGDPKVTIDRLIESLVALGVGLPEIGRSLARAGKRAAGTRLA